MTNQDARGEPASPASARGGLGGRLRAGDGQVGLVDVVYHARTGQHRREGDAVRSKGEHATGEGGGGVGARGPDPHVQKVAHKSSNFGGQCAIGSASRASTTNKRGRLRLGRGRRQSGASAVPLRDVLPRTYDAVNELLFALSERHPLSIRCGLAAYFSPPSSLLATLISPSLA